MDYGSSSEEEEAAPKPIFECALAELLGAGVTADVRGQMQKFEDTHAAVAEAYARLPPTQQEQLKGWLPEGDAARVDGLRNPQLSEALREFTASLKEVPTPAELQRRRNAAWIPAVGDRCEAQYKASTYCAYAVWL